jgi:hypothetical protein
LTETVCAQGIFSRRNDGNRVRALFDEEASMSADYMVSLSLSFGFGGIYDAKPDKKGSGDTSSGKGGSMMSMGKSGKCGSMMSMGKAGKMFTGRSR